MPNPLQKKILTPPSSIKGLGAPLPEEAELSEMLNQKPSNVWPRKDSLSDKPDMPGDIPFVPKPGIFRPDPVVVGDQRFAKQVNNLLKIAPELRGRSKEIRSGPDDHVIQDLEVSGFGPNDYGKTNLLGTTNKRDKSITINPRLSDSGSQIEKSQLYSTLAHELGHVAGYDEGKDMEHIESLAEYIRRKRKIE